jgi:glycosyltransferase involved in cell wall biosynthesis
MSTVYLIEPESNGAISGGFVYNRGITHGVPSVVRLSVPPGGLRELVERTAPRSGNALLIDSLLFRRDVLEELLPTRAAVGCSLGLLLHAFPSFIERAQRRDTLAAALPLRPTQPEIRLLSDLDFVLVPGAYAKRLIAPLGLGLRCRICPPGVDTATAPFAQVPAAGSTAQGAPLELLSIGAVTPLKGFTDAARALAPLTHHAWHWTIVGSTQLMPTHVAELRLLLAQLGLDERVTLAGQLPRTEIQALLQQTTLLLLPSYTENHPLVALEALSHGVPVFGYDNGGSGDIVEHGRTGLLAPVLDIEQLSQLLSRALSQPDTLNSLRAHCRAAAASLISWETARARFLEALRSLDLQGLA